MSTFEEGVNPELFRYDADDHHAWQVFDRVTVATVAFDRLERTRELVSSLYRLTQLPFELLVVDNASTDGTGDYLRELAAERSNVRVIENRKNVGKSRALLQIRDALEDGLLVYFDNDMEVLSNYWLLHVQKAYHAFRLARGTTDLSLGLKVVNQEEYGFRHALRREVFKIPHAENSPPRTSFAAAPKDAEEDLVEEVVLGWTDFVIGGAWTCPATCFARIPWEAAYPKYIGGVDTFYCDELAKLELPLAVLENGPVCRHGDWPYTAEKIELYRRLTTERAVADRHLLLRKLRRFLRLDT